MTGTDILLDSSFFNLHRLLSIPGSFGVGRRLLLKKKQVIFVFSQVLTKELSEICDKTVDLFIGKTFGQNIGQFPVSDKLKKKREGALVLLTVKTKTDLMGVKTQTGISAF